MFVDLSIVVPAYNEALRITPTLERCTRSCRAAAALRDRRRRRRLARLDLRRRDRPDAADRRPALVRQTPNRGKGAAVRAGMLAATGQIRVMCDADGSMPRRDAAALARADHRVPRRDRDRLALRARRAHRSTAAVVPRDVEPALQQGHPALARAGRARHAVRLQGVHRRGRARAVLGRADRRLGVRPRDPRARAAAAAWRSKRSASSGPTTAARA